MKDESLGIDLVNIGSLVYLTWKGTKSLKTKNEPI
jgi:hypothetical protein